MPDLNDTDLLSSVCRHLETDDLEDCEAVLPRLRAAEKEADAIVRGGRDGRIGEISSTNMKGVADMDPDRRKGIWKRLRFWGVLFLLVVVGIGVLCWHSYRKAMGPPPTHPGKSPEFDKHLAEIDEKWLFVFAEDGKVVVTDIYGENDTELALPKTGASAGILDPIIGISSNPEGKWAALYYVGKDPTTALLGLVDLRNLTMKVITSERLGNPGIRYLPVWLSDKTFILPLPLHEFQSGHTLCRVYDLDDLEHPKTVEIPVDSSWLVMPVNDTVSHALLFWNEPDNSGKMEVNAYDKNGLRDVTKEEEERF